jgi:hypothetical protein
MWKMDWRGTKVQVERPVKPLGALQATDNMGLYWEQYNDF